MNTPHLEWNGSDGNHHSFNLATPDVLIGRRPDCNLVVNHRHVSRHHAKIVEISGGHQVVDLESRYGTFVNGERVGHCQLFSGDKIRLAEDAIEFEYVTANDAVT